MKRSLCISPLFITVSSVNCSYIINKEVCSQSVVLRWGIFVLGLHKHATQICTQNQQPRVQLCKIYFRTITFIRAHPRHDAIRHKSLCNPRTKIPHLNTTDWEHTSLLIIYKQFTLDTVIKRGLMHRDLFINTPSHRLYRLVLIVYGNLMMATAGRNM
jgi:hypothetical protein